MKKNVAWTAGVLAAVALGAGAYLIWKTNTPAKDMALHDQMVKQLVDDYSTKKLPALSASISSQELVVKTEEGSVTYKLPRKEFFVSIAPYVNSTHPCATHNLSGCQGEMVSEPFDVTITDKKGNTVVSEFMTSHANGFIDLWLPRNDTYKVTIENGGKKAEATLGTFKKDNTCITTMQLG